MLAEKTVKRTPTASNGASDNGTLFLDEIGDLPKTSQAALLRVLQEREVTPLGSTKATKVDLRVISATHRRVDTLAASDAFRSDLYACASSSTYSPPPPCSPKRDRSTWVVRRWMRRFGLDPEAHRK